VVAIGNADEAGEVEVPLSDAAMLMRLWFVDDDGEGGGGDGGDEGDGREDKDGGEHTANATTTTHASPTTHAPGNTHGKFRCRASLGLKWKEAGSEKPATGTEIKHALLAAALQEKVEFKKEEWAKFKVAGVCSNSYIKAGDRYFKPAILPSAEQVPKLEHFLPRSIALKKVSTAAKAALVAGMPHRSKEVSSQQETPANREQARVRAELEAEVAMDDKDWQLVVSATVRRFVAVARLIDEFENLNRAECSLEAGASHPPYY